MQGQSQVFTESWRGPDPVLLTANENLPNDLLNTGLSPRTTAAQQRSCSRSLLLLPAGTSFLSQNKFYPILRGGNLSPKPQTSEGKELGLKMTSCREAFQLGTSCCSHPLTQPQPVWLKEPKHNHSLSMGCNYSFLPPKRQHGHTTISDLYPSIS